jgi:hypothetical protein
MNRPDEEEVREITAILAELPPNHPARVALASNRTTVQIMYLLIGRPSLLHRVTRAHNEGLKRQRGRMGFQSSDNESAFGL